MDEICNYISVTFNDLVKPLALPLSPCVCVCVCLPLYDDKFLSCVAVFLQVRVSRDCPKLRYHVEGVHQTWTSGQNHTVFRAVLRLLQICGDVHIRHCLRRICHFQGKSTHLFTCSLIGAPTWGSFAKEFKSIISEVAHWHTVCD